MSSDFVALNHTLGSIGPALANHLWQSTAFAAAVWPLTLALRSNQARVRHAIWLAASIKFLIPFSLLIAAGNLLPHPKQAVAPVVYSAMDVVEEPFAEIALPPAAPVIHTPTMRERLEAVLPATLAAIWFVGAGVVLVVWARRWRVVRRTLREAEPAYEGREIEILRRLKERFAGERRARPLPLRLSAERMEPGIFGVWRPVLVWPEELSARLDDGHIEAIVAHELAHVRRRDNLTAAAHMLVETVFWFHPLVWWMERQMMKEREQACDEAVVRMANDAQDFAEVYAESLLKTCRFCIESPLACVAGVTGADLKQRVVGIVTGRALLRMSWPKKLLLAAAAVCVVAVPVVLGQAKSARRMADAMLKAAPAPFRAAAHAMIADAKSSSIEAADASQAAAPPTTPSADDMSLGPAFEVATIRPASDPDCRHGCGFRLTPSGRLTVSAVPLEGLVAFSSFHYPRNSQVAGGPSWAESQKWDITAETNPSTIPDWNRFSDDERMDRIKPMLLKLVIERFHLKIHTETRTYSVYAMVPAKGGVKVGGVLKRVDPPPAHVDPQQLEEQRRSGKLPLGSYTMGEGGSWLFLSVKPYILAIQIAANCHIDGTVIDQSGLDGYYDLTFTPDRGPDAPPFQDQVEVQLGLRFEPKKVPMPTYVIDSAEKPSVDGAEVTQPAASAANTKWVFDVASIKVQDPNERMIMAPNGTAENFEAKGVTVQTLVAYAYDLPWTQGLSDSRDSRYLYNAHSPTLVGDPAWASRDQYDVTAKADPAVTEIWKKLPPDEQKKRLKEMVQAMLADRFHLKVHTEKRDMPAYALVVAKGGPKVTPSTPDPPATADDPAHPKPYQSPWQLDLGLIGGHGVTMEQLAQMLWSKREIGSKKVIDRTGLTDKYDFKLKWTPEGDPDDAGGPSLFTATQEQLGLKLEPTKAPMDVVVIDHIEPPSEN